MDHFPSEERIVAGPGLLWQCSAGLGKSMAWIKVRQGGAGQGGASHGTAWREQGMDHGSAGHVWARNGGSGAWHGGAGARHGVWTAN